MARAEQLIDAGLRLKLAEKPTEKELKLDFQEAIKKNRFARVQQLLKAGADPNKPFVKRLPGIELRTTPLGVAVVSVPMTELLLRNGANLEQIINAELGTPLSCASSFGNSRTALWLLHRKANVKAAGPRGKTILHGAVANPRTNVIEILLDKGLDIEARTPKRPEVPEGNESKEPTQLIAWREEGATPLLLAAGNPRVAELLLKRGANRNVVDEDGAGLLHYAVARGFPESLSSMLKLGLDVNKPTKIGATPLHVAAANAGWYETKDIELLLAAGANREARDVWGRTPADLFRRLFMDRLKDLALTRTGVEIAMGEEIARANNLLKLLDPKAKPISVPLLKGKDGWLIYDPIKLWDEAEVGPSPVIRRKVTGRDNRAVLKLSLDGGWTGAPVEIRNLWLLGNGTKEGPFKLGARESREITFPMNVFAYGGAVSFEWRVGRNSGRYQRERYAWPPRVSEVLRGTQVYAVSSDPFGRPVHFRVIKLIRNDKEVVPERKEGVFGDSGLSVHSLDETGTVEIEVWLEEERQARKRKGATGDIVRWSSGNHFLPAR